MGTSDSQRWETEDRLFERVRIAQATFDRATDRQGRATAARDLKQAIDQLLDYVMRDILPPDLQKQ